MGLIKSGSRWAHVTPLLLFTVLTYSWGNVMYGLDTGSFGSQQALPSFLRVFGDYNEAKGTWSLPTERKSIMNSVTWIGKALGCALFEPVVSRVGYKWVMVLVIVLQIVGVVIEMTAKDWVAFSAGRVIAYLGVGFVENAVPAYESEIAPTALRGFISGSLIMLTTLGNVWGALMSRGYQSETKPIGYLVPVGVMLIPPVLIAVGLPFTPESPRWLVSQGRNEEALRALNRIRPKREVDSGSTAYEIQAFDQALEEDKLVSQGSWLDLFRSNYPRRLMIAMLMFVFQQWTGGQFVLSYGPTFYTQLGGRLAALAFTINVLTQAIALVGCIVTILFLDKVGRRPFLIVGTFFQILFMCLVAGLGGQSNPTGAVANGMVASVILFNLSVKVSLSTNAYLIASEIGGVRMRKKIISVATFTDVVAAFVITWTMPYLLNTNGSGVNLGARVGWIFAGIATCAFVFVTFFVPEFAGRSLEEVDELFGAKLWAWQFKGYKTSGVGARIAQLERGGHVEDVATEKPAERSVEQLPTMGVDTKEDASAEPTGDRKV